MNCCGKCFLKNELKENQEDEQENNKVPVQEETVENYYFAETSSDSSLDNPLKSSSNFDYDYLESQLFTYNFLDPPESLALTLK